MITRTFTLEEANRTLPLVARIVDDVVEHYDEWQRTVEVFEVAAASSRAESPSPEAAALQHRAQQLARDIQGFISELTRLGLEFKGFDLGLVDFPGELEGRRIFWCWKRGESSVQYWHDVESGYGGRQPVDSTLLSSTGPS